MLLWPDQCWLLGGAGSKIAVSGRITPTRGLVRVRRYVAGCSGVLYLVAAMGTFTLTYTGDNHVRTTWPVPPDDAITLLMSYGSAPVPSMIAAPRAKRARAGRPPAPAVDQSGLVSTAVMMAAMGIRHADTPRQWRLKGCPAVRTGNTYRWDLDAVRTWRDARPARPSFEDRLGQHLPPA